MTKARELIEQAASEDDKSIRQVVNEAVVTQDDGRTRIKPEADAEIKAMVEETMTELVDAMAARGISANASVNDTHARIEWNPTSMPGTAPEAY